MDRKSVEGNSAKRRKTSSVSDEEDNDDDEAIECHMTELAKETKKTHPDEAKVARLMSLTFCSRKKIMMTLTANSRVMATIEKYSVMKKPLYVSVAKTRNQCCANSLCTKILPGGGRTRCEKEGTLDVGKRRG